LTGNHLVSYSSGVGSEPDQVFKVLADPTRRRLLDRLRQRDGQTLKQLCANLDMTRPAVAKHLGLLESANLVATVQHGREKLHYLNPVPIQQIWQRWTRRYEVSRLHALTTLKTAVEENTMAPPDFVYTIYITASVEEVWRALTDPDFTRRYWGIDIESEWTVGARVTHRHPDQAEPFFGGEVLESAPPKRLRYSAGFLPTAGNPDPDTRLTTTTFELERVGPTAKLTVYSTDPREDMRELVHQGWPMVLSSLKTLLETGKPTTISA
jgi:uncharacterized protein YndB with AHSA1/START domain